MLLLIFRVMKDILYSSYCRTTFNNSVTPPKRTKFEDENTGLFLAYDEHLVTPNMNERYFISVGVSFSVESHFDERLLLKALICRQGSRANILMWTNGRQKNLTQLLPYRR